MDAGKIANLPDAVWDALIATRGVSPQAGAATPDDSAPLPPAITPGVSVKIDTRAVTAAVLPAGGYTVNLSPAAVTASRVPVPAAPLPAARVPLPQVQDDPKAAAKPAREEPPATRANAERPAPRTEQGLPTASNAGTRPDVPRPAISAAALPAAALNAGARPEAAPRGLPAEPAPQGVPVAVGASVGPAVGTAVPMATPSVVAAAVPPEPGGRVATPEERGAPAQPTAAAPLAPRPYLDRVELSTDNGLLVASPVAPRPQAAPEMTSAPIAMPAPPGAGPRTDVHPAFVPAGAYTAAAHQAVAAEEAKAASRLSHRPAPELVQQLLIPHDAPRPPAPELYRLVVAALVLGILLYILL